MTDRQRLITKFVSGLSDPVSLRYNLHFLYKEKDEPSRHMLMSRLAEFDDPSRKDIHSAINNAKNGSGSILFGTSTLKGDLEKYEKSGFRKTNDISDKKMNIEKALKARSNYCFKDAIKYYKLAKTPENKFFYERAYSYLIIGNYAEALSLATKGMLFVMQFVMAMGCGEFDIAKSLIRIMLDEISKSPVRADEIKDQPVIITNFELAHLIMYCCFATETSKGTQSVFKSLKEKVIGLLELTILSDISELFINRNFSVFLSKLDALKRFIKNSIYTKPSSKALISRIEQNVIANEIEPYGKISFATIGENLGIPVEKVSYNILKVVRSGSNGKVDLVNNVYIGGAVNQEERNLENMLNRSILIRQNFQLNLWKAEYNEITEKLKVKDKNE